MFNEDIIDRNASLTGAVPEFSDDDPFGSSLAGQNRRRIMSYSVSNIAELKQRERSGKIICIYINK